MSKRKSEIEIKVHDWKLVKVLEADNQRLKDELRIVKRLLVAANEKIALLRSDPDRKGIE